MKLFGKKSKKSSSRVTKNRFVSKSGAVIKLNRSFSQRFKAHKDNVSRMKADRLNGLPKNRIKRFFARFEPKRVYHYWFSREGAIMALKVTGIGAIAGFLILVGLFAYFRKDLPKFDKSGMNLGGSIRYYDKTGQTLLWEDYDAVKRIPVDTGDISHYVADATVAVEDKDFFKHGGFDVRAIIRAGWNNLVGHGSTQGGSTITQQLVKLTEDWSKDRTVTRKIKEVILSVEVEKTYSKQDILTAYLNTAPYGGVEYGVEAAARDYFNKSAKDLTLDEAAMLATIPKSPRYYSPYSTDFDGQAFVGRQHYVLDLMYEQGKITKQERDAAKSVDTLAKVKPRQPKYAGIKAPYFVLTAKEQLENKLGSQTAKRGGWKVITTLDLNMQKIAEEQVASGIAQVKRQGGDVAAMVAEDVKTGQVVALVGGPDFSNPDYGQNNYAHDYKLPPGSSFKPYDYTSAMENTTNFGAGTVLYDSLGPLPGYYPCTTGPKKGGNCLVDYDFRFPGPLTVRYALGGSRNIPAVKAMLIAGIDKTIDVASKLMDQDLSDGVQKQYQCYSDDELKTSAPCYASSAIGDGAYLHLDAHVHGFATLSRNGRNIPQTYILKIEDAGGKTVDEWKPSQGEQVVREDSAYIIDDILSDPNASYFSYKPHRYKGWKFSLKTGTTNDAKDGLMMMFSPRYAAGVWVGYHNRRKPMSGFMETMTEPIVGGFMRRVHDGLTPEERPKPTDLQTLPAFVVKTHVGVGSIEPSPATDLFPSWYKAPQKGPATKRIIDIVSNKLATSCTPDRAKKEVDNTAADSFSADIFFGGTSSNSTDQDDVHHCDDVKPTVSIVSAPASCASGSSCSITVDVEAGTHPLSSEQFPGTVNVIIAGQTVQSFSVNSSGTMTLNFTYSGSGTEAVTAQVIDSVLYDGSDARNINFTGGGGGGSPLVLTAPAHTGAAATTVTINWSGGSGGPYTAYVSYNGGAYSAGCHTSGNSCSISTTLVGTYKVYVVKDSDLGSPSNTVTISKP